MNKNQNITTNNNPFGSLSLGEGWGEAGGLFLLAGPCAAESKDIVLQVAETVNALCIKFNIPYIFKASYKKANRSRVDSFTGMGMQQSLEWIALAGKTHNIPTVTDIIHYFLIFIVNYKVL